jgi:hypothetical protein
MRNDGNHGEDDEAGDEDPVELLRFRLRQPCYRGSSRGNSHKVTLRNGLSALVAPIPRDWDCRGTRATVPIPRGFPAEFVYGDATGRSCELPFGKRLHDTIDGDAIFAGLVHVPLDAVAQMLGGGDADQKRFGLQVFVESLLRVFVPRAVCR